FPGFPLPAPYIHQNKGSSDMGKCLTNLAAASRTGIGIQSLEKVDEGRTNRNNFKYLAIDGVTSDHQMGEVAYKLSNALEAVL
ncbi:MAG: hypothetical protein AAGD13_25270, partial [Pseudomonadota bacterium]